MQTAEPGGLVLSLGVSPAVSNSVHAVAQRRRTAHAPPLQPLRQDHSHGVHAGDEQAGDERHQTVEDSARVDVAAQPLPLHLALRLGQRRRREPAHGEAQRQRVTNDELASVGAGHVAQGARAVCDARVEDTAVVRTVVVLRRAVQQHIEVRADVHMAQLQRASQRKDERDVFLLGYFLADDFAVDGRTRGQPAGQGGVAVNVEFEEVEEGIADEGNRAVDLALGAVVEFKGLVGLFAYGERNPLQLVLGVLDMLAGFSVHGLVSAMNQMNTPQIDPNTHELRFMHST